MNKIPNESLSLAQVINGVQREASAQIRHLKNLVTDVANMRSDGKPIQFIDAEHFDTWKNGLEEEQTKVQALELNLAFIGTMKAGKSMILNAIIGARLLPSRDTPMTTIPTVIRHVQGKTTPSLQIDIVNSFNKAIGEIKRWIKHHENGNSEWDYDKFTSDINETIARISLNEDILSTYSGENDIYNILIILNDVIRICNELDIENPLEELSSISQFPLIEVEFSFLRDRQIESSGQLSLIDAPGPNEAKQPNLRGIVQSVLSTASAVVCVLDYTQLKGVAEGEIKQFVRHAQELVGSRLYVLVNKFDQQTSQGLNRKDAIMYVSNHLFPEKILENQEKLSVFGRVFVVSGKSAFFANMAARAFSIHQSLPSPDDEGWVRDFASLAYGTPSRAERQLKNLACIEHQNASNDLWGDSFMEEPLSAIVDTSLREAALQSLKIALDRVDKIVHQIIQQMKLFQAGLGKEINELQQVLSGLDRRLRQIDEGYSVIRMEKQTIQATISKETWHILQNWRQSSTKIIHEWYHQTVAKSSNPNIFNNLITTLIPFERIREDLRVQEIRQQYSSEKEASAALQDVLEKTGTAIKEGLDFQLRNLHSIVNISKDRLDRTIEERVQNLLQEEQKEIEEAFNIRIDLPLPDFSIIDIQLDSIEEKAIRSETRKVKKTFTEERRVWWTLFLIKRPVKQHQTVNETFYIVDPDYVKDIVLENINIIGNLANNEIVDYTAGRFQECLDAFFSDVSDLLNQLKLNIEKNVEIRKQSHETQEQVLSNINSIYQLLINLKYRNADTRRGFDGYLANE